MRRRWPWALACVIMVSAIAMAAAQPVPVPMPTPRTKVATIPPPSNQRALVERVNAYLTSIQKLVGDFVQVAPNGSRTDGKFYLQKPGRLRFDYNPPSQVELVADGQTVVIRNRRLKTQDPVGSISQTPLRFLLAERVDLLLGTKLVAVRADNLFVTIVIEESEGIAGTYRLTLKFAAQDLQLKQWTVTDQQGYDTTVAVYNLATPKALDPDLFKINYERVLP